MGDADVPVRTGYLPCIRDDVGDVDVPAGSGYLPCIRDDVDDADVPVRNGYLPCISDDMSDADVPVRTCCQWAEIRHCTFRGSTQIHSSSAETVARCSTPAHTECTYTKGL